MILLEKVILINTLNTSCALFTRNLLTTAELLYYLYPKLQQYLQAI